MEIRIAGYLAASWLLEQEPQKWHALVILDSNLAETDFLRTNAKSHFCLRFDDVEETRTNKISPSKELVQMGLAYAKGKDRLLVSCRAGQGRSAAMAFVIASRELGADKAVRLLDATRHRPNRLVVSIGDGLLDSAGTLEVFDDWRRRHSHIQLSDYYEEIEKEFEELEAKGAVNKICK